MAVCLPRFSRTRHNLQHFTIFSRIYTPQKIDVISPIHSFVVFGCYAQAQLLLKAFEVQSFKNTNTDHLHIGHNGQDKRFADGHKVLLCGMAHSGIIDIPLIICHSISVPFPPGRSYSELFLSSCLSSLAAAAAQGY